MALIKSVSVNGKKVRGDSQVVQGAASPIWQVKQSWALRFDPASAKILIFKQILLQTMEKIFYLTARSDWRFGHLIIVPGLFFHWRWKWTLTSL